MIARPARLCIAFVSLIVGAACADASATSPSPSPKVLTPAGRSDDGIWTPGDSALCRSGYSLPEGRSCPVP